MGGFRLVGGKWMAVVANLVVKRFSPLRHSRYLRTLDGGVKWPECDAKL